MTDKPDLETRVQQFQCMQLPGQPLGMHMGTSYLVNDLWSEVKRLRALSRPEPTEGQFEALRPFDISWVDHPVLADCIQVDLTIEGTSFRSCVTVGDLRRARASYRSMPLQDHAAAQPPKGWKLVPVKATDEMLDQMPSPLRGHHAPSEHYAALQPCWKRVLAAAPAMVAEQGTK